MQSLENTLPLFKSHYSIGRSILTLEKEGASEETGPKSIFDLARKNKLQDICLVEDSIGSIKVFFQQCKKSNFFPIFGLRVDFCSDSTIKDNQQTNHKVVVFCKNKDGYKDLVRLSSYASKEGFWKVPRLCEKSAEKFLTKNLYLSIPFYDSFIFNNSILGNECVFNYSKYNCVFFVEDNGLQFDELIKNKVTSLNVETLDTKTIYYAERKDFLAYQTYRCFTRKPLRTTISRPELPFFSSNNFCLEALTNG